MGTLSKSISPPLLTPITATPYPEKIPKYLTSSSGVTPTPSSIQKLKKSTSPPLLTPIDEIPKNDTVPND